MRKLTLAVVVSAVVVLMSLGAVSAQETYQDLVGTWEVNMDTCRPCVMTITAVDNRGNLTGTHTSLTGEITPLVGKAITKKGAIWLLAKTPFGTVTVEVALCEDEMGGHYTVAERTTTHHQVTYKKVA